MATETPPTRKAYTVKETGALLGGLSKHAVLRLIHADKLAAVKAGNRYLVAAHEIDRFVRFGEAC